jgi:hypothetical protein
MFLTSKMGMFTKLLIFRAIQQQTKEFAVYNSHVFTESQFFTTLDPFVIDVQNSTFDLYKSTGLFLLSITWNYPEANVDMMIRMVNAELYYSQDRPDGVALENSFIYHFASGSVILENVNFETYAVISDFAHNALLVLRGTWNPFSSEPKFYNITNVTMTTYKPKSPHITDAFAAFNLAFSVIPNQPIFIKVSNMTIFDMQNVVAYVWKAR